MFFNPSFLSVGAICTSYANLWSTYTGQFIGFLFGSTTNFSWFTGLGTTVCNAIHLGS